MPNQELAFAWPFGNGPVRVGTQGLFRLYLKTFVAPFLPARLTAPGSPRMNQLVRTGLVSFFPPLTMLVYLPFLSTNQWKCSQWKISLEGPPLFSSDVKLNYFGRARSKGFATLRNVSKLQFFDKIGHAKSVGFRFYSATWRSESRIRDISRSLRFLWFIL